MDAISQLLDDPDSPVRRLAAAVNLPCCGLCTVTQLAASGMIPQVNLEVLSSWNLPGDNEYERGCLWKGYGNWDNLPEPKIVVKPIIPRSPMYLLVPGCWHEIQVWNSNFTSGHNYFLHLSADGKTLRLVDSTTDRGFRDREIEVWDPLHRHTYVGVHVVR